MKTGRKAKIILYKLFVFLVLRLRLYYVWSRTYQLIFESKYNEVRLPEVNSLEEIEALIQKIPWEADTWYMLWDAISKPQATYARWKHEGRGSDCDDQSMLAMHYLNLLDAKGLLKDKDGNRIRIMELGLLSVPWVTPEGKNGGHNVCAFSYEVNGTMGWAHISNRHGGKVQWGYGSLEPIVRSVLGDNTTLGWAFANEKLQLQHYHWSIDDAIPS